jgi:preprotein translocase subunit SecG
MLNFGIYLLTAFMVIDCLFLVLLVLVQLPKKEAGMGQAFGGGATDALFGAGSGNVLTKVTKWCAAIFFALAIALTIMGTYKTSGSGGRLQKLLSETPAPALPTAPVVSNTNTAAPIPLNLPVNPPAAPTPATPTPVTPTPATPTPANP